MSALEFWTQTAIWVLIVGSLAVFAWFVRDLLRLGGSFGGPGAGAAAGTASKAGAESRDVPASRSRGGSAPPGAQPPDDAGRRGGRSGTDSPGR